MSNADVLTLKQELTRRARARQSLVDYSLAIEVPGRPATDDDAWLFKPIETVIAAHHQLILDVTQRVITGVLPRAMFFLPPGSGKSSLCSVVAPTWAMGRQPGTKIILASYGSDLARRHGRRARQIVKSVNYSSIFGTTISNESSAADEWSLTNGSEYLAGGILSGLTGARCQGLLVDDPVKGRDQADSEVIQKTTWEAYNDDLRTRLIPGGWEIIVQTRWSDLDLAGRLLPENYDGASGLLRCRDGRDWYVLCLPAICERKDDPLGRKPGDPLWPEWFTPEHFAGFKAQPRTWSALFQQRPQPDQGTFFVRDWFTFFTQRSEHLHVYGASDYAVTEGRGDFTEHGVFGVDPKGDVWVLDWWHGQTAADVWIDRLLDLFALHKPFCWFGESGVIKRAIEPYLAKRQQERGVFCRHEWIASISDKPTRARSAQALASAGKLHLPDTPAGHRLLDQLLRFPAGAHDDAVDVVGLFCRAIDQAHPGVAPPPKDTRTYVDKRLEELMGPEMNHSLTVDYYSLWDDEPRYGTPINTMD